MVGVGTAGVVLAAGGGWRFTASGGTGPKLLADLGGRPVLRHVIDAVTGSGLEPVYVVAGATEVATAEWQLPGGVVELRNPGWTGGLATSLQVALAAAARDGHDAVVVGLGDQPFITAEAWRRVSRSTAPIAVATYGTGRGHPVRLAADVWPLLPVDGDAGAREVMRAHPDMVSEVPCPGHPADIDTVHDLEIQPRTAL